MRFKVPQNVQREDHILWFITLKQLVFLIIGGGISYMLFVNLNKSYDLNTFQQVLIWVPAAIATAIAFIKIYGLSLSYFTLLIIETIIFRAPRRFFQSDKNAYLPLYTTIEGEKKEEIMVKKEALTADQIQLLAQQVDSH